MGWPGLAPEFNVEVALTATQVVLLFCQSVLYRELDEVFVANRIRNLGISNAESASSQYSGDLVLRFLPDIYDRLKRTTAEDPILPVLVNFAKRWPLSSVGIPDTGVNQLPECYTIPSMFRAYVDRIIQREDVARCADQQVAKAVKAAIGDHRELAPCLADYLSDR